MTTRLNWHTSQSIKVGDFDIPCSDNLPEGFNQGKGVKRNGKLLLALKSAAWPVVKVRDHLICDGFIEREAGRLIRKYTRSGDTFLEVGCGDMNLRKYVPEGTTYNALDLLLSEFHVRRVLKRDRNVNVAIASATDMPLPDKCVSVVASTETLEHIPPVDRVLDEIHRVLKPGGILIVTIPNNYCYMYARKGPHPRHVNNWKYAEFVALCERHGFELLEGHMKGYWVPLPPSLVHKSYALPVSSADEHYNMNFFYAFRRSEGGQPPGGG